MRKGTLFLSAVLSVFTLAILFGVVSAYQNSLSTASADTATVAEVAATEVLILTSTPLPAPTAVVFTPEQAAALASQILGRTDLFSVETTDLNGASVYLVTFSSGDLVYISPEGQVVSISKIEPVVVNVPAAPLHRSRSNVIGDGDTTVQPPAGDDSGDDDHGDDGGDDGDDD